MNEANPVGLALLARRAVLRGEPLQKLFRRSVVMGSAGSKFGHMVADATPPLMAVAGSMRAARKKALQIKQNAGENPTRRGLMSALLRAAANR